MNLPSMIPPRVLRRLLQQAKPVLLGGLVLNILALCLPLFSMLVYDKIIGNDVHETLWALVVGMLLVMVLDFVLRLARAYVLEYSGAQWDQSLDRRITAGVLAHPLDKTLSVGAFFAGLREIGSRRELLSGSSLLPLVDIPFLGIFLLFTWAIGGPLVFVPLSLGLLVVGLQFALNYVVEIYSKRAVQSQKEKIDLWHALIVTRSTINGSARTDMSRSAISRKSAVAAKSTSRLQFWLSMLSATSPAVSSLTTVLILVWGVYLVESLAMSTGQLIAASILASRTVGSFMSVQPLWMRYVEVRRAFREMSDLINLDDPVHVGFERQRIVKPPSVNVENLSYAYPSAELATLSAIKFAIEPGQLIVVVGKVGCGKSTLLKILAGHFAPSDGSLVLGELSVNSIEQARHLAWEVAYLDQSPLLFEGTVESYLFGEYVLPEDRTRSIERMHKYALEDLLAPCSLGLTTPIAFAGGNLSGGQRRVLAFIRTICLGRYILVLDEPTSGLDSEVEKMVLNALCKLKSEVTIVIASHSAEIVSMADRILVIDKGRQIGWGAPRSSQFSVPLVS